MNKYLTIQDASKVLGVTPQTLRNWDKLGKLKPKRHPMNNYRIYKESDLIKLLKRIET